MHLHDIELFQKSRTNMTATANERDIYCQKLAWFHDTDNLKVKSCAAQLNQHCASGTDIRI